METKEFKNSFDLLELHGSTIIFIVSSPLFVYKTVGDPRQHTHLHTHTTRIEKTRTLTEIHAYTSTPLWLFFWHINYWRFLTKHDLLRVCLPLPSVGASSVGVRGCPLSCQVLVSVLLFVSVHVCLCVYGCVYRGVGVRSCVSEKFSQCVSVSVFVFRFFRLQNCSH